MSRRLPGFDYSRPYFYMVTLKCHPGRHPLSEIVSPGVCRMNGITRAMVNCIRNFHIGCPQIAPIECFSIMPDHIHLLIRLLELALDGENTPLCLETIVSLLMQSLQGRYTQITGLREELFLPDWHDWIVLSRGQLAAFTRYIRENPKRHWLRSQNRPFFTRMRQIPFARKEWYAYGNPALLELPVIEPFRCSRSWTQDDEWQKCLCRAERIGPGGAGVGTFLSPCEKVCGNAICQAAGSLIVLTPEGFAPKWHPSRSKELLCAKGKMLFLSLWPFQKAKYDNATLYRRCHQMGDLLMEARDELPNDASNRCSP